MSIFITGGGGFLGAWIIRRLNARGIDVRVFDRSEDRTLTQEIVGAAATKLDWRVGDISSKEDVKKASQGCDFVIHLAALLTPDCSENPILGANVNLIGTLNIFEAVKENKIRGVAYASSAGVFGPDDGATPYPITHYGAFKLATEGSARAYWSESRIPSIGFRPLIIYGPGREVGLTAGPSIACREAAAGRPYTIGFSGASDMIFVDDVAAAFEATVLKTFEGAHAFSLTGEVADVSDIVAGICNVIPDANVGWNGPVLPIHPVIAPCAVEAILGPLPRTSLLDGLRKTIDYYQAG